MFRCSEAYCVDGVVNSVSGSMEHVCDQCVWRSTRSSSSRSNRIMNAFCLACSINYSLFDSIRFDVLCCVLCCAVLCCVNCALPVLEFCSVSDRVAIPPIRSDPIHTFTVDPRLKIFCVF